MRKISLIMITVCVMMAVLSGCASASPAPANPAPATPAPTQEPEVKETVAEEPAEEPAEETVDETAQTEPGAEEEPVADEAEEEEAETAKDPDAPCYTIAVNWTFFESDDPRNELYIELESGTSEIDPMSIREVQESYEVGYCKVNGTEVPVFTREVLEDGYFVEILRDDIKYSISWETFSNLVETDCKAVITGSDGSVKTISRDEALYRGYTGAWYFGIGTITNGQFGEYEVPGDI